MRHMEVRVDKMKFLRIVTRETFEWLKIVGLAFVISLLIKNTVAASAVVPTGSMEGAVMTGSRIVINKLAYLCSDPQRGDIVSFYYPDDGETLYLKRVIGLPGETIEGIQGKVYINGREIQDYTENMFYEDFGPYIIPDNCYFMMGDNRSNSWDSRYWNNKYVDLSEIMGKAEIEYYPEIKVLR